MITPKNLIIVGLILAILFYFGSGYFTSNKFAKIFLAFIGLILPYSIILILFFTVSHELAGVKTRGESYNEWQAREKEKRNTNSEVENKHKKE